MKKSSLCAGVSMLALAIAIAFVIIFCPAETVKAAGDVPVNDTNFPDESFREYVLEEIDKDKNKILSEEEIVNTKKIDLYERSRVGGQSSNDLKGIEYFTELEDLSIGLQDLETVDLSKNTKLTALSAYNSHLKTLDLSNNKLLRSVNLNSNELTVLDLSGLENLKSINCDDNKLSSIKVPGSGPLEYISLHNNQLTELDLSACNNLITVQCEYNKIKVLDISNSPELDVLFCYDNKLESLNVKNNTKLTLLHCENNLIPELVAGNNTLLNALYCQDNALTKLVLPASESLSELYCYHNKIGSIDISDIPNLVLAHEKGSLSSDVDDPDYLPYQYTWSDGPGSYLEASLYYDEGTKIICNPMKIKANTYTPVCGKSTTLKLVKGEEEVTEPVVWKTSDKSIATVDDNGKVTAKSAGKVTITATSSGRDFPCELTVLYKDVTKSKDFWYTPTYYLTAKGIVKGYDKQTKFKPANKCTRAQMVTFLWRLRGSPEPSSKTCKFKDVKEKDYFYKACIWGNENGIVEGYKNGTFGPQIICARKHAVTFLWRLAGSPTEYSDKKCKFKDVKKSDYFYEPVIWASETGILEGYKDGTFRPNGNCLRRQMVTFLYRFDLQTSDD